MRLEYCGKKNKQKKKTVTTVLLNGTFVMGSSFTNFSAEPRLVLSKHEASLSVEGVLECSGTETSMMLSQQPVFLCRCFASTYFYAFMIVLSDMVETIVSKRKNVHIR